MPYIHEKRILLTTEDPIAKFNEWAKDGWNVFFVSQQPIPLDGYNVGLDALNGINSTTKASANYGTLCYVKKYEKTDHRINQEETVVKYNGKEQPDLYVRLDKSEAPKITIQQFEKKLHEQDSILDTEKPIAEPVLETPIQEEVIEQPLEAVFKEPKVYTGNRVAIVVPCYKRPQRTRRVVDAVRNQNINHFQAIFIGDNCDSFDDQCNYDYAPIAAVESANNRSFMFTNFSQHTGGFGNQIRQFSKMLISAEYVVFLDNDDVISPNHLEHYLSEIEDTDLDFVIFNTWDKQNNKLIEAKDAKGHINHGSMIIRSEFYKSVEAQKPERGHEWTLFLRMRDLTPKWKFAKSQEATYMLMSNSGKQEEGID